MRDLYVGYVKFIRVHPDSMTTEYAEDIFHTLIKSFNLVIYRRNPCSLNIILKRGLTLLFQHFWLAEAKEAPAIEEEIKALTEFSSINVPSDYLDIVS